MSAEALAWVRRNRTVRDPYERLVLVWMADDADSETGYCFPSYATLAEVACLQKSTIIDVIDRLEAAGVILVRRPAKRGRGHFNQYVLVMDRDPASLEPCWKHKGTRTVTPRSHKPATEQETVGPTDPSEKVGPTDLSAPSERSGKGREKVGKGSAPPTSPSPNPVSRASASRSSCRASSAPTLPAEIDQLREQLGPLGAQVDWRMSTKQAAVMAAAVQTAGLERVTAKALELVDALGAPTYARAWERPFVDLASGVPLQRAALQAKEIPACGECDGHVGGPRFIASPDGRERKCPRCHPSFQTAAEF